MSDDEPDKIVSLRDYSFTQYLEKLKAADRELFCAVLEAVERQRAKLNLNDAMCSLVCAVAAIAVVNNVTQASLWTTSLALQKNCEHLLELEDDDEDVDALVDLLKTSDPPKAHDQDSAPEDEMRSGDRSHHLRDARRSA